MAKTPLLLCLMRGQMSNLLPLFWAQLEQGQGLRRTLVIDMTLLQQAIAHAGYSPILAKGTFLSRVGTGPWGSAKMLQRKQRCLTNFVNWQNMNPHF